MEINSNRILVKLSLIGIGGYLRITSERSLIMLKIILSRIQITL
nr:MAG TPA: hypothetical protein [Crassvirales sp.]